MTPKSKSTAEIRELIAENCEIAADLWRKGQKRLSDVTHRNIDALEYLLQFVEWRPADDAPKDRLITVFAPSKEGLPPIVCSCQWHEDAGFCVDEIREVTHFVPLPPPPAKEVESK
jgi:hypothetical protein